MLISFFKYIYKSIIVIWETKIRVIIGWFPWLAAGSVNTHAVIALTEEVFTVVVEEL